MASSVVWQIITVQYNFNKIIIKKVLTCLFLPTCGKEVNTNRFLKVPLKYIEM